MLNLIKNHAFDILSWLPGFILTARRKEDGTEPEFKGFNWHQLSATLIIMLLTAFATSYMTTRENAQEIKHLTESTIALQQQVAALCKEHSDLKSNFIEVKVKQDERIAHEKVLGVRK